MEKTFLLCDCLGSQDIDAPALSKATGLPCSKVYTCLCTDQIGIAAEAMAAGDTVIACQQERPRFEELAAEIEADVPEFVDIRDRAGWHDDKGDATPKMAALLAEQQLAAPAPRVLDVVSEGTCLIMAPPALALEVAETVADTLAVTVLWQGDYDTAVDPRFDVVKGDLRKASGALGNFNLTFDQLQMLIPGGRGAPSFTAPRDGAKSQCDIILDLTGNTSLFPAPHKRDGYLRADPGSKPAVAEAVREAMQMVGTFEKPLYVRLTKSLCAHSRAEQPACSNCLDLCPTGAITSAGEHVAIDPMICAGCGSCSAVCPSGAITYDAPPVDTLFRRVSTLASTYRKAGGNAPRLLVHDEDHGAEMIRLYARFGAGLPVDVIPLAVDALAGFGHAEMLAALGCGFAHVDVLLSPRTERDVIEVQAELARAISGTDTIRLIDVADPDALETALVTETAQPAHDTLLPLGTRRQVARLAGKTLQPEAKVIDLPDAAPYGAVLVDTDACTLCLSCVSLCPSGALGDNPDLPQLRFQEDACLQCGLCANICPEDAITLKPQLNLTAQAFTQVVLHEEEPFACIECGSLFGVKSTVEKITEKLAGKHAMFASSEAAKMIQMCDNCRINAQYHAQNNPLAGKDRPRVRTSEDYFSKRKDH
ncbi:MAG: 4Fe-4S binding protein [Sulfitobacter litoralis]|uniref:4Fe-4S dicluster domain-containing protein n=1 Tax=Sulfitobacter litoralis TaxID=335975 RepID=A0ABY0RTI2_9RHOB|nr:4Fe-4S binding protein [Sulfitobacter litoralis]SDO45955.1 4Fe-4S dicluster domain-containing protein [Sulfitobacter litoralis]